jgi:hypothetical protein
MVFSLFVLAAAMGAPFWVMPTHAIVQQDNKKEMRL